MQHHAVDERQELCATLRTAGPAAPTLCGGWTTTELAAHLVLRERSVKELGGRVPVRRLRELAEQSMNDYATRETYERVVQAIEHGPSPLESGRVYPLAAFWAFPPVREAVNLLEYVIHHEDVRRADGDTTPRLMPVARQHAVWQRLRLAAPLTMRAVPVGVRLCWPGHGEIATLRTRRGGPVVTISGEPVELALIAFGRQPYAHVDYDGARGDVERVRGTRIPI